MLQLTKLRWYNVYLNGRCIDKVPYCLGDKSKLEREEYVRDSLIKHDDYESSITVREQRT